MVTCRSAAFERVALRSFRRNTDVDHTLTIVDNSAGSRPLTAIWNGWARRARAPHLCFANPDVVFGRAWASRLLGALSRPDVVVAAPCTPSDAASPRQRMPGTLPRRLGAAWRRTAVHRGGGAAVAREGAARLLEWYLDGRAAVTAVEVVDDPYSVGFCHCVRREWLHAAGYFDEATFPFYGGETDLNFRAFATGKRAVCVRGAIVYHHGGGSHDRDRTSDLHECFGRLKARWPSWEHQS